MTRTFLTHPRLPSTGLFNFISEAMVVMVIVIVVGAVVSIVVSIVVVVDVVGVDAVGVGVVLVSGAVSVVFLIIGAIGVVYADIFVRGNVGAGAAGPIVVKSCQVMFRFSAVAIFHLSSCLQVPIQLLRAEQQSNAKKQQLQ